uniref:hypothetical protein n=1 Tax=Synechococcus sp. UW106 TaxID=368495 RepID=UPI001A7E0AF2
ARRPRAAGATSSCWKSFIEFLTQESPNWARPYCRCAVFAATRIEQFQVAFYTSVCSFLLSASSQSLLQMSVLCLGLRFVSSGINKKTDGLVSFVTHFHVLGLLERLELKS